MQFAAHRARVLLSQGAVLAAVLVLMGLAACKGTPWSTSCDPGTAGCECTRAKTCSDGSTCFQRWCWGGEHPAPDTYYYTPKNLKDIDTVKQAVRAALALEPGGVMADIGCGQGSLSFDAAELLGPTGRVIATDLDPGALEATRRYLETAEGASARASLTTVLVDDPRATGLEGEPDASVDLILMINSAVFESRDDPAQDVEYLGRFLRKLRPGGRLIYHRDWLDFDDLDHQGASALFTRAGFTVAPDVPMPPGIPEATYYLPEGPRGPKMDLRRGYIMVLRRPES